MTPSRPYLLRAFYEWLVDNDLTPHLVAEADLPGVKVPQQYVQNGQIVLNASPGAIAGLVMGNEEITFSARFGGVPFQVCLPIASIKAIYARENGAGTVFEDEPGLESSTDPADMAPDGGNFLKSAEESVADVLSSETISADTPSEQASTDGDSKPKKGKPTLRVIK